MRAPAPASTRSVTRMACPANRAAGSGDADSNTHEHALCTAPCIASALPASSRKIRCDRKRIAGHQGSLGSRSKLDSLHGPSVKEGRQILDFAVVSLHPRSECRRRPARYQKISWRVSRSVRNSPVWRVDTPAAAPRVDRRLTKQLAIVRGKLAQVPEPVVHGNFRDRTLARRSIEQCPSGRRSVAATGCTQWESGR